MIGLSIGISEEILMTKVDNLLPSKYYSHQTLHTSDQRIRMTSNMAHHPPASKLFHNAPQRWVFNLHFQWK